MKAGFTSSILAHMMVVGFGVVSLSSPRPMNVADVEALPVDIIPIESITKTIQGDEKADRAETPAPKPTTRPETVENAENTGDTSRDTKADAPKETKAPAVEKTQAPAAEPEPVKAEEPTPVPIPELAPEPKPKTDIAALTQELAEPEQPQETEESFQAPQRVTTPKRRPTRPKPDTAQTNKRKDEKKVAEAKKREDKKKENDKIAALLNKEDASAGGAKRSTRKAALGTKKGNNAVKMSQSEVDALRGQIQSCWNIGALAGRDDAEKLRARVEFRLKPDGTIDGKPSVDANGGSSRSNRTFAGSARRAVMRCAPYDLPRDKYEDWADVVVNFSLKDML